MLFLFQKTLPETTLDLNFIQLLLFVGTRRENMSLSIEWCFFMGVPSCRFRKKHKKKTKPKVKRGFRFSKALPPQTNPTFRKNMNPKKPQTYNKILGKKPNIA